MNKKLERATDNAILEHAFHDYTCGKKCVLCGENATQMRIEYEDILNNRNESIIVLLLDQWNKKTNAFIQTEKIKPYCYFCKIKNNPFDILENRFCITYIGNSALGAMK